MRRCFLPIGQGAFYCESFMWPGDDEPFNVVYDCGAIPESSVAAQLDKIDLSFLGKSNTIHLFFLSHFDCDHYNCVEILRNKYQVKFKNFYYPGIDNGDKYLVDCWFKMRGLDGSFFHGLCLNQLTTDARWSGTTFVPIAPTPPPESPQLRIPDPPVPNEIRLADIVQNAGFSPLAPDNPFFNWVFRTFNYRDEHLLKMLNSQISAHQMSHQSLTRIWADPAELEKLVEVYEEATKGDINGYSMTMFSGIPPEKIPTLHQRLTCCQSSRCLLRASLLPFAPGCLYTGDYNASITRRWNYLYNYYAAYWDAIGCLQVPHHGACRNFNPQFLDLNAMFVASVGAHNSYGHPHPAVKLAFQQKGKHLFCVTEDLNTCLCTTVS